MDAENLEIPVYAAVFNTPDEDACYFIRLADPMVLVRIETCPNEYARIRIVRETEAFAHCPAPDEKVQILHALLEYAVESGHVPKPKKLRIVEDLGIELTKHMVVHDMNSDDEDSSPKWLGVIHTDHLELTECDAGNSILKRYLGRLAELQKVDEENIEGLVDALDENNAQPAFVSAKIQDVGMPRKEALKLFSAYRQGGKPLLLIDYESEFDYRTFRDKAVQPATLAEWRQLLKSAGTIKETRAIVLDGSAYLRWLSQKHLTLDLRTQHQFAYEKLAA